MTRPRTFALLILALAGCPGEEPPPSPAPESVAREEAPATPAEADPPAPRIVLRTKPFAPIAPPARSAPPPGASEARPKPSIRFADLMTRAVPLVPREEQRRWLELRRRVGGGEDPALARLSGDDRHAFDEITAALARESPTHPVVAEILRRTRDAS